MGYQGIEGSNTEEAAKRLMDRMAISEYVLVPSVTSFKVITKLLNKEVDYAVVATKNNIGGMVHETYQAVNNVNVEIICKETIPIRHLVFAKSLEITPHEIKRIISHEQAIKQCSQNIKMYLPNASIEPVENTAIGAKNLSENKYDNSTAVICTKTAGVRYNLSLLFESFEDHSTNRTEFNMYQFK